MNFDAEQELIAELRPGERLRWTGRPRGGVRLIAADALQIPFSLLWSGFVANAMYAMYRSGDLVGLVPLSAFALIGVHFLVGRFFFDAYRRARTFYGLTDERVLIVTRVASRQVRSLPLAALQEVALKERADWSGDITLGQSGAPAGWAWVGSNWPGAGRYRPPTLESVENAREVYDEVLRAQQPQQQPQPPR